MQIKKRDVLDRLKLWDRCYPGNMPIELMVDDAIAEITRLRNGLERIVTFAPDEQTARWASNVLRGIEPEEQKG